MSGLQKSQQFTTCESARQHFHQLKAGQWEGSRSRFPKRPILSHLRINLQDVKLIHKQVLHNCEMSEDLITNRLMVQLGVPSACKTANTRGGEKILTVTPQVRRTIFRTSFAVFWKGTIVQSGALCCFPIARELPRGTRLPLGPHYVHRKLYKQRGGKTRELPTR